MLREQIQDQLKGAMKAKDRVKLDSLRYVWSEIKNREIDKHGELTDDEIVALLQKEVKNRKEAIEEFRTAGRDDLVNQEEDKLVVLTALLPEQMSEEEISELVNQVIGKLGEKDFGSVMKEVMARVKGKADGKVVSTMVKARLVGHE